MLLLADRAFSSIEKFSVQEFLIPVPRSVFSFRFVDCEALAMSPKEITVGSGGGK